MERSTSSSCFTTTNGLLKLTACTQDAVFVFSVLHVARGSGCLKIVQRLVECGAEVTKMDNSEDGARNHGKAAFIATARGRAAFYSKNTTVT